ncbi:MAG: FxsA family protein [Actinobacteria bacterium]|nr:FxsA family protein [Actinomycetota bacterium]
MAFVLLVVVPIVEIVAAAIVAHFVGWATTVLALVVLSLLGAWQLKVQGLAAWATARNEVADGAPPAPAVLDGVLRFLGAVLLAAPGFVTALIGAILLVRPARRLTGRRAGHWVIDRFSIPFVVVSDEGAAGWKFRSKSEPDVVDVDSWEDATASVRSDREMLTPGSSRY